MSERTTDHDTIRQWAEERGGRPALVADTATSDPRNAGVLRIHFPDAPGGDDTELEDIDWDRFFETFDANSLEMIYEDETADGKTSRFSKFVNRSA